MKLRSLIMIKDEHGQNQNDGGQGDGEGDVGVEQEAVAAFFDLELPLTGDEVVTQKLQPVRDAESGHGAVETAPKTSALGLTGRLRRILLKLRKPAEKRVESGGASPPQQQSRSQVKGKVDAAPAPGPGVRVTGVNRRARLKAVVKYLSKIKALARRRRRGDGRDLSATGRSRASIGKRTRSSRSSVAAAPPRRSETSVLQLQDGIEDAIAHCKRSLDASFA
jgi:hypothetical protein